MYEKCEKNDFFLNNDKSKNHSINMLLKTTKCKRKKNDEKEQEYGPLGLSTKRVRLNNTQRLKIARSQMYQCVGTNCLKKSKTEDRLLPTTFEIDHKIGLQFGGSNEEENLQALCPDCHRLKTQIENQIVNDRLKEKQTKKSRYWDPFAIEYLKPVPLPPILCFHKKQS